MALAVGLRAGYPPASVAAIGGDVAVQEGPRGRRGRRPSHPTPSTARFGLDGATHTTPQRDGSLRLLLSHRNASPVISGHIPPARLACRDVRSPSSESGPSRSSCRV